MRINEIILGESVNDEVFQTGFRHHLRIGDYTYAAESYSNDTKLHHQAADSGLTITCFDGTTRIAWANFELVGDHLESAGSHVQGDYRGRGIASTMYAYARMLGNNIKPSSFQSPQGERMWQAWQRSGEADYLSSK